MADIPDAKAFAEAALRKGLDELLKHLTDEEVARFNHIFNLRDPDKDEIPERMLPDAYNLVRWTIIKNRRERTVP